MFRCHCRHRPETRKQPGFLGVFVTHHSDPEVDADGVVAAHQRFILLQMPASVCLILHPGRRKPLWRRFQQQAQIGFTKGRPRGTKAREIARYLRGKIAGVKAPGFLLGKTDLPGQQHGAESRYFHHFLMGNAFKERLTRAGVVRMFPQPTRLKQ